MPAPKKVLIIDDNADYRRLVGGPPNGGGLGGAGSGRWRSRPGSGVGSITPKSSCATCSCRAAIGFLVCRNIRSDFTLRHTKIIVTSGRDYDSDRLAAREAGADEYLTKPVKPYDLLAAIAHLC